MVLTHTDLLRKGVKHSFNFSFDQATLEGNIKLSEGFDDYDYSKPSTWPLITLDFLNGHLNKHSNKPIKYEYTGRQGLPAHVAYEIPIMEKFVAKHASKQISRQAITLHGRFSFNFTSQDILKKEIGMTALEETAYK